MYTTVPSIMPPAFRTELPDPVLVFVNHAVTAMDRSFQNWDTDPNREIDVRAFIAAFVQTFGSSASKPNVSEADKDGNQRVSRDEARRFLAIQMGLRRGDGMRLREPGGRVCNLMLFQHLDSDKDDQLDRAEVEKHSYLKGKFDEILEQGDDDEDGKIAFSEWHLLPTRAFADPVNEFRAMDVNLDARVDSKELVARTPEWKKNLAKHVFPGFDLDQDGTLSLYEYRLTMQANPVLPWHSVIVDSNGDAVVTFNEFKFQTLQFPLLRFICFQRLDVNGDAKLDASEFYFRTKEHDRFYTLSEDGSDWRELFTFEGQQACGSVAVSPDGKKVAFDSWSMTPRTSPTMYVMNIDGTNVQKLTGGSMPTWSKDGSQLAFSSSGAQILDVEDGGTTRIAANGWGAQWSPDGKSIAFTIRRQIAVYDVASKETQIILTEADHKYRQIYWNMSWSPDSQKLCFKGTTAEGVSELAILNANADEPNLKVRHSTELNLNADFAWHPDGERLVFGMACPERRFTQLYEVHPDTDDPPQLLKGQDETRNNSDVSWSPDGKQLIVVSGDF